MDFAPDISRRTPGVLSACGSLVPTVNDTYRDQATPYTEGYSTPVANEDVIGSALMKNKAGTQILYAGTSAKLLQANGTTGWTDRSGAAYTASSALGTWVFAQLGDVTLAANGADKIQAASGGAFADADATAPAAKIVIVHENAALAFNTSSNPEGWYRSDTNDYTNWTASAANDVDSGSLSGVGGPITAATVFGPLAIAWKNNAMYAGYFTAGAGGALDPKIRWDFVPGGMGVGCCGANAFVETDIGLIFVSDRDVMLYNGGRPRSIADKIRKYLFGSITSRANTFISHNEAERTIYIWYAISGARPNRCIAYNYQTGKWGDASQLSNSTDTVNTFATCAVRNANYNDYSNVGGMGTNSALECNAVWVHPTDNSGGRLANFAYSANAGFPALSGPSLTTGYVGTPEADQTLSRILLLNENGTLVAPTSSTVTSYDAKFFSRTDNASINSDGHIDITKSGRYFSASITWRAGRFELKDLEFQFAAGRPKR